MVMRLSFLVLVAAISPIAPLKASLVQLDSPQNLNMVDDTLISIPGAADSHIQSPLLFSAGGELVTISQSSGLDFLMVSAGAPMAVNFLYNDVAENGTPSPMTIQF